MFVGQNCEDCNTSAAPCQDLFGSNATSEGGILGRSDAVYTSIEAQTSTGSLHAYSQVVSAMLTSTYLLAQYIEKVRKEPGHIIQ